MDDFNVSALHESKNEWGARLVTLLTPLIIDGYKSIIDESLKLCKDNNEMDKYLMTFQNLISRIPKWNQQIVEAERKRICEKSACNYLEDLVTCVHIIQLKILTAMRVGQKQKKIDISVPKLDDFIHKVYINVARKIYKNVYLFEINIQPLQIQKNYRELEIIVQECILNTLRESIPVEAILKAYMDESIEEDVIEEIKEEVTHEHIREPEQNVSSGIKKNGISFNDIDYIKTESGVNQVNAPKNIDRLEEISAIRNEQRKRESEDDDDNIKLSISDQEFNLDNLDIHNIEEPRLELLPDLLIDEIEVLE
jgi:phosphopantetheinyl transferase (holo-ACP synthase)